MARVDKSGGVTYDTSWMADAKCGGMSVNFPGKSICSGCPVQVDCLDYALLNDEYGIWGGTDDRQRTRRYPSYIREAMREDLELF